MAITKQDLCDALEMGAQIGEELERERIAAWLRTSADQIIGNLLTGDYDTKACEMAALAIEIAAKYAKVYLEMVSWERVGQHLLDNYNEAHAERVYRNAHG